MSAIPACSICWEQFTSESALNVTKCGHLFHSECIKRWQRCNSTCPECRQSGMCLYRVYLNFNYDLKDGKTSEQTTVIAMAQEIENLVLRLSLEEEKCKTAEKLLQESEAAQREREQFTEEKEKSHQRLLKSYEDKLKKLETLLKKERHRRRIAEKEEEALVEVLNSLSNRVFKNFSK